jgi:hypothetical protein
MEAATAADAGDIPLYKVAASPRQIGQVRLDCNCLKLLVKQILLVYSNVRGGGNCEAISDGAGVSL